MLLEIESYGVNTSYLFKKEGMTGNAIIQVDDLGQNSIIVFKGANFLITSDQIKKGGADKKLDLSVVKEIEQCIRWKKGKGW